MQENIQSEMRRKGWTYLLLTVVLVATSVLSILFINSIFGDGEVIISLSFLTVPVALTLLGLLVLFYVFDTLRFYFVLRTLGIRVPIMYMARLSFINVFVSAITPFATGGGFAQIYFLTRKKVPMGSATAASTIRTLLAVAFFFIAAPVVMLWNPALLETFSGSYVSILIITVVVYCLIVGLLLYAAADERRMKRGLYRLMERLRKWHIVSRKTVRRVCLYVFREVRHFNAGVRLFLRGSKKFLALSLFFTVLFLFALFSFPVALTAAMGYKTSPVEIYQSQVLITFLMYFAFTPGATGIAEGAFALMFSGLVGRTGIVSLTLLWRFFSVYIGAFIGLIVFYCEMFFMHKKRVQAAANDKEM